MKFLRNLLANILGIFVSLSIIGLLLLIIITIASNDKTEIPSNSIIKIDLSGMLLDRAPEEEFPFNLDNDHHHGNGLEQLDKLLRLAENDQKIKGILLQGDGLTAGAANIYSLKNIIEEFKERSNKPVFFYSENISQLQYYLSTSCDSILLHPLGHMEYKGIGAQLLYFKTMLDKLGIEAQPIRVGKFKSAIEPYILDSISNENRQQVKALIDDIWKVIENDVQTNRGISKSTLDKVANNYGYLAPEEALEHKFIDAVTYEDQRDSIIRAVCGDFKYIKPKTYLDSFLDLPIHADNKIAVVYAEGAIVGGCDEKNIAANNMIATLDKVRKDKSVKAIVLRVNSPGGSAQASEKIWRKLSLIQKDIPVIVSMGNVAASGGYYIACAADTIVAEPSTITGSIGVFGLMFNVEKLKQKIGLNVEKVKTHDLSDFPSFDRPLNQKEMDRLTYGIEEVYKVFIKRVADARGLSTKEVEAIAQGRIWTGNEAKKIGLVDELGDLNDAISIAANKIDAGDNYKVVAFPEVLNPIEKIVKEMGGEVKLNIDLPFKELNLLKEHMHLLETMNEPKYQLPYIIDIH